MSIEKPISIRCICSSLLDISQVLGKDLPSNKQEKANNITKNIDLKITIEGLKLISIQKIKAGI
ncbi:hypothetical protein [Methylomonas rosea]|uniref:Uncharacterized protein n=1 Tax=Methylomonas rosea TaxID=2952227 RepID=A0ABT1TYD5_9GAMM|nr:hypothetical protein [Methylomonas sp. WSC-7]MCQ8119785.1 hypothetical protein [Methylomonas sp. WSC-7]